MTTLPLYRCHDCRDAELYALWDSITDAVIRSYRIGWLKGFAVGGIVVAGAVFVALRGIPSSAEVVARWLAGVVV